MRDDSGLLLGFLYYGLIPGTLAGNYIKPRGDRHKRTNRHVVPNRIRGGANDCRRGGAAHRLTAGRFRGNVACELCRDSRGLMYPARR